MGTAQIIATVLAAAVTIVAVALAARAVLRMTSVTVSYTHLTLPTNREV